MGFTPEEIDLRSMGGGLPAGKRPSSHSKNKKTDPAARGHAGRKFSLGREPGIRPYVPPYGSAYDALIITAGKASRRYQSAAVYKAPKQPRLYTSRQRLAAAVAFNEAAKNQWAASQFLSAAKRLAPKEILDRASAHLEAEGVSHFLRFMDGVMVIEITASDITPLNRFARGLRDNHGGARIVYEPQALGALRAMYRPRCNTIYLPHDVIDNASPRSIDVLHEVRHSLIAQRRREGYDVPWSGFAQAIKGRLPSVESKADYAYSDVLHFEEIETFAYEIRAAAQRAVQTIESNSEKAKSEFFNLEDKVRTGSVVAERTVKIMKSALGRKQFEFSRYRGVTRAMIKIEDYHDERIYEVTIDLPESKDPQDRRNPEYLRRRLLANMDAARVHSRAFRRAMKAVTDMENALFTRKKKIGSFSDQLRDFQRRIVPLFVSVGSKGR
ncbi:MAG: hypothetical protein AABZ44_09735 [Elusimicrobiota bacterium]